MTAQSHPMDYSSIVVSIFFIRRAEKIIIGHSRRLVLDTGSIDIFGVLANEKAIPWF